ncbi:ACP S-malonyltransferase [Magnetococcales bacterium HHB-1]
MGKVAWIFPGQGAQKVGMGKAFFDMGGEIAKTFQEADDTLGENLSRLMFEGPAETLSLTENTQPALVTTAVAALRFLQQESDLKADFVAGHSLGEYAAICAANGFSFADAIKLVKIRGRAMQSAVAVGEGAMAAMLGMEDADVEAVCKEASEQTSGVCVPANFNTPGQIVISGNKNSVDGAIALAKERGAKRCMLLDVSAPFHCPLMQPAADTMAEALSKTEIVDLDIPLIANVSAAPSQSASEIQSQLIKQVTGAVRWYPSVTWMIEQGVDHFIELGTGRVLSGMMRRINRRMKATPINQPDDIKKLA